MTEKSRFINVVEELMPTLEQYVPVVDRVHGAHHPEFHEVRAVFNTIHAKTKETINPDLNVEFTQLRKITDNYVVPDDVCESYEAVYDMLKALDTAYLTSK
ncbi:MAG TPA: iron-sulfur cluster repair di-iron protein, ric [Erysipelotrichaceae bacterium]|nr:iron-sulfur cluster repair di-iron protein, ric [Erysipelotrichaceae bacterium]